MRTSCRAYVARTQLDQQHRTHENIVLHHNVPSITLQNGDQILLHRKGLAALITGSPLNLRIGKRFVTVQIPSLRLETKHQVLHVVGWDIVAERY